MANITDTIQASKVTVGPAAQSNSGSLRDNDRAEDFGTLPDVTLGALKNQVNEQKAKLKLNKFEKMSAFDAASQNAAQANEAGANRVDAAAKGAAASADVRSAPFAKSKTDLTQPYATRQDKVSSDAQIMQQDADAAQSMFVNHERFEPIDVVKSAFSEQTVTGSLIRLLSDNWHDKRDFAPDATFDAMEGRETWGKGLSQADTEWVLDASSLKERQWKLDRLAETRENSKAIAAKGEGVATVASLGAGLLDVPGWVAGMGIGKVAQLAEVGVAVNAARIARASQGAVEGAVGNVLSTAAMSAAGEHITPGDYFYAGMYGAGFGAAIAGARRSGGARDPLETSEPALADEASATVQMKADDAATETLKFHAGVLEAAQNRLGPDATPEQVAAEAHAVYNERANAYARQSTAVVGDKERLLPDFDYEALYDQTKPDTAGRVEPTEGGTGLAADDLSPFQRNQLRAQGVTDDVIGTMSTADALSQLTPELGQTLSKSIESQFSDPVRRLAIAEQHGLTALQIPDNAQRLVMGEMKLRIMENQPTFDPVRTADLISKYAPDALDNSKIVASFRMPQLSLSRSEVPEFRWWAANMLESPTQNGGPRTTAAVEHGIRQVEYNSFVSRYNEAYVAWRNQNGGSAVKDILFKGPEYERFNRLVSEARENRLHEINGNEHPHVARAADALDEGYQRLANDQRSAKTLGSEALPPSSRGYSPRHLNPRYLETHPIQRDALIKEIGDQLDEQWRGFTGGSKLAREVAANYINRVRKEGAGGAQTPGHISDPSAAANMRDALAQHALSPEDIERYMARISRGGAKHTKSRLDLELDKEVTLPNGQVFNLRDAFIQDPSGLFRSQARRVNGDVTLSRRKIMGQQGAQMVRDLAVLTYKGPRDAKWANELKAFDQTVAEFMGQPFGNSSRPLDNLRILTGASRLGQAVLPQMAETAQIATTLGTEFALRYVKDVGRLIQEARKGTTNPMLHSIELPGGRIGDDQRMIMPWQSFDEVELGGAEAASTLDKAVRGAANAQYTLTGQRYLQASQERGVAEQILHKVFRYVRSGEQDAALRSMGFTPELSARIKADIKNVAEFDADGGMTSFDIRQTADPEAMYALRQLIERGSKQIIQGNFIGERQAFVHDSLLQMLTQFRRYSITAMSKQWTRVRADQGTMKAVGLLMGQMSFALPIHVARVMAVSSLMSDSRAQEYRDKNLSIDMLARATLNYTTLGGSSGDIFDAGAAMGGLEMSGVRSGNQSVLGNVPALGYITQSAQAFKDKDVSGIIKAMPDRKSVV